VTADEPAKPTISEVAQRAGVGRSSAARVLGGYGSVSAYTRERVLAAAAELGYETNELARSMSTGVTMTIGVILADIANPFFSGVLQGISEEARRSGYGTVLVNSNEEPELEDDAVRLLVAKQVDGLIVAPSGGADAPAEALRWAQARGLPIVQVDRTLRSLDADAVVMDNRDAAREATEHLLIAGHRRIALAWGPQRPAEAGEEATPAVLARWAGTTELSSVGERYLGYADALADAGIPLDPALVMTGEQTVRGVRAFARGVLADRSVTAVVATEQDAAVAVLAEARRARRAVPADLSLIAFDHSPWAGVFDPPIMTVQQPVQHLGEEAARRLIARIGGDGSPVTVTHLASTVVESGSVGRVAN
jgi:LacI family transcriptional regulator